MHTTRELSELEKGREREGEGGKRGRERRERQPERDGYKSQELSQGLTEHILCMGV